MLDCQHTLCLPCADKLASADPNKLSVTCPECRQPTDCSHGFKFLKTRYFGKIRCDICHEKKQAEDMWWCQDCVMVRIPSSSMMNTFIIDRYLRDYAANVAYWNTLRKGISSANGIKWNKCGFRSIISIKCDIDANFRRRTNPISRLWNPIWAR